jgi:hypothetical protein
LTIETTHAPNTRKVLQDIVGACLSEINMRVFTYGSLTEAEVERICEPYIEQIKELGVLTSPLNKVMLIPDAN